MDELFETIRAASTARSWSRGIELARAGAVLGISHSAEEVVCRVKLPHRVAAADVTLYPRDGEWDCTCGSRIDPCECVVAVSIALKRAGEAGTDLPETSGGPAHLVYRFTRSKEGLGLERYVTQGAGDPVLLSSSVAAAGSAPQGLAPTQVDLNIDRLLLGTKRNSLQPDLLNALLGLLGDAPHVELDGAPIQVASTPLAPVGYLEDTASGFRIVLQPGAAITEIVAPGVALAKDKLFRLSHTDLTGPRLELLPSEKRYSHSQVAELVTDVLPGLLKRFKIEINSRKLPALSRSQRPRIVLDVEQQKHRLSVLPLLVYGDPPCARIDAGKLVHLVGEVPVRDEDAERSLAQRMREQLDLTLGKRITLEGDAAARFAARLENWSGELRGDTPAQFVQHSELRAELSVTGASFQLRFRADGASASEASAEGVIHAWQTGASMVPLLGGGWAPLPSAWLDQHGHRVAELLAARDARTGEVAQHARLALAQLCHDSGEPLPDALSGLQRLLEDFKQLPQALLPGDLRATLRDYQREGINWLCFLRDNAFGALLADDMGLGKTLQALTALQSPALVVCPRSLIYNWADELRKFRPQLSFAIYHGPSRQLQRDVDVLITTYSILRLDKELLGEQAFATVVLDEAQNIKNPDSQVAQAAYCLQGDFKLALSGTPVENRLEELWSQFHFTNRGLLGTRSDFNERFAGPIAQAAPGIAAALRQRIRPFLLRRLKRDVATDLPPRTEVVLHCELTESERATYDAVRAATQLDVLEQLAAGGNVMAALEALLRLRQAACHPALLHKKGKSINTDEQSTSAQSQDGPQSAETAPTSSEANGPAAASRGSAELGTSSKLECLLDALQSAAQQGHKALVFSQWTSLLDLVEPLLTQQGISFNRLDGATRDRAGVVAAFQAESGPSVMLLSLKAGGVGLNLTAADYVFLLDPWWNPAAEDQAADRAHRIGQDKPVVVYRLVARETVEERILELQQHKRQLAQAALEGGEMAARLTREDLARLLAP